MQQKTETNRNSKKNERKMVFRKLPDIYEYKIMNKQKKKMKKGKSRINLLGKTIVLSQPTLKTVLIIKMILEFILKLLNKY